MSKEAAAATLTQIYFDRTNTELPKGTDFAFLTENVAKISNVYNAMLKVIDEKK
jgi:hypothetical protein